MSVVAHEQDMSRAPLSLAEHLDLETTAATMWRALSLRSARGHLRSAWSHTEYALNQSPNICDFDRMQSFVTAQNLTGMVLDRPRANADTVLDSLILASYIPVFRKRAMRSPIQTDDCRALSGSLARVFAHLRPTTPGQIPSAVSTQLMMLSLSARTSQPDYLMYPSSPREESSPRGECNHDAYFLHEGQKYPIQQKLMPTNRSYDEQVGMMVVLPLLQRANAKCGFDNSDHPAELVNHTIGLLAAEGTGESMERCEKQLLDTLSESVVAHQRAAVHSSSEGAAA